MIFKLTLKHRSVCKKLFGEYVELIYEFSNLYRNSYYHYDDNNGVYYVIDGKREYINLNYGEIRNVCSILGFEMSEYFWDAVEPAETVRSR